MSQRKLLSHDSGKEMENAYREYLVVGIQREPF